MFRLLAARAAVCSLFVLSAACRGERTEAPPHEEHHAEHAPEVPESVRVSPAAIAEAGIETWKVQPVDLAHALVLTGSVGFDENRVLDVASNVKGRVTSIPVDLGDRPARGAPLVWIESVELSHAWDEVVRSGADVKVAEAAYERAKRLHADGVISASELEAAEATSVGARAEADTAERALRLYGDPEPGAPQRLAIRAPFAGRVIERKVTPGTLVEALQPLVRIADFSHVWVFLYAYEKDLAAIHDGLSVMIRAEAYPQERFLGRVDFVGGDVDVERRAVRVRATVANAGERLKPGMFVTGTVDVPRPENERHDVLAVPQAAIQSLEGRTVLFLEAETGVFVRRFVELGHTFEGFTEVLAGIEAGDRVVTEGSFVIKSEFAKASLAEDH